MNNRLWHVVWTTNRAWPPHDRRGDWSALAALYAPLIATGAAVVSHPLQARYLAKDGPAAVRLEASDCAELRRGLHALVAEGGDRIAAGLPVSAAAFLPAQSHVLLGCQAQSLPRLVGRLKRRLAASCPMAGASMPAERSIWSRGFWAAELLTEPAAAQVTAFIGNL